MFMNTNKINIIISNMIECFFVNRFFILLQKTNPNYFNENYVISSVTGSLNYSIWNLNRKEKYINFSTFQILYNFYRENDISINFVFENPNINEEEVYDNFSNLALSYAHEDGNSISLYSNVLENYIKNNYPSYKIFKITSPENKENKYIEIDSRYNSTINKVENKQKTIITLNPICPPDCKLYDIHREYLSQEQKNFYAPSKFFICPLKSSTCFYDLEKNPNFISNEEIKKYIENGFYTFRINANYIIRNTIINYSMIDIIESYVYYLIKPNFQNEIRHKAIEEYIKSLKKEFKQNNG